MHAMQSMIKTFSILDMNMVALLSNVIKHNTMSSYNYMVITLLIVRLINS